MANEGTATATVPTTAAPATAATVTDPTKAATTPAATTSVTEPAKAAATPGAATTEPAKTEPAKTEPAKAAPVEVKKEDLKLPDGSLLDPKTVDEVLALSKEKGWTKETAQGVLERESKALSSYIEGETAKLTQVQNSWTEAARTDKEIGGEKFAENVECSNRVFKAFGNEAVKNLLDNTKAGNHPDVIRMFNRIGRALGIMDDSFVMPSGGLSASGQHRDAADVLYGNSKQEKK